MKIILNEEQSKRMFEMLMPSLIKIAKKKELQKKKEQG